MNGEEYFRVLQDWLPEIKDIFKFIAAWILQWDNDPIFGYIPAQRFFAESKIELLDWPSSSPDLNPIENLWDRIKREVEKLELMDLPELEFAIYEIFQNIPLENLRNLISSMDNWLRECIDKGGAKINY